MAESLCCFCQQGDLEVEKVGETFRKDGVTVHENCLYFASGLAQNGDTHEGIQGFLICDILTEVRRSHGRKARLCAFCKKKGAAVGCAKKSCRRVGHFPCLKQPGNFLFQHFDCFQAFCPHHAPKQRVLHASSLPSHTDLHTCCICLSPISNVPSLSELYCPSCKTFLHRDCLQRHAWSTGRYIFRCPVCNNQEEFLSEMLRIGIDVPERDAEWERSGQFRGAYEEIRCCRAEVCLCPDGRNHDVTIGKFRMRKCVTCSQSVGHLECTRGEPSQCKDCATPSHQTGISSLLDKDEKGTSEHGDSDNSEEGGEPNSNPEPKGLDDEKCNCCVCRAKLASGSSNTSPVTEVDVSSEQHQTPQVSSEKSSSSFSLPLSIKAEELVARSAGQEGLSSGDVSPSTGQTVSVRRKLNFAMPLPAAKRAKTEPSPAKNRHLSRQIPVLKINKLKAEDYLPFSRMKKKDGRGPL